MLLGDFSPTIYCSFTWFKPRLPQYKTIYKSMDEIERVLSAIELRGRYNSFTFNPS